MGVIVDNMPLVRRACGTLSIWARKPGTLPVPTVDMAEHPSLHDAVSVVVPCHNEEANVGPLIEAFDRHYASYVQEYIVVNDNSRDDTSAIAHAMAAADPRIRVIDRPPPAGVGRALTDGLAAARGRYILTLDCDFVPIVPELRDVFDAAAEGADLVLGSRFSRDSVLVHYPVAKIVANRLFHALARPIIGRRVRDLSNNLKLFRREVVERSVHPREAAFRRQRRNRARPNPRRVGCPRGSRVLDQSHRDDGLLVLQAVRRGPGLCARAAPCRPRSAQPPRPHAPQRSRFRAYISRHNVGRSYCTAHPG